MAKNTSAEIRFEIDQIDHLLAVYADLLDQVHQRDPNEVEVAAIATILHSFYNGVENIFLSIAKGIDEQIPAGPRWHRDLLIQMSRRRRERRAVLNPELVERCSDYLGFRHFYRHSYSFFLNWTDLKNLVLSLRDFWSQIKKDLYSFLDDLNFPNSMKSAC